MIDNPTLEPGIYEIPLSDYDDVERISVTTSVVPKPPPRIYVEVKVERKPPTAGVRAARKKTPSSRSHG